MKHTFGQDVEEYRNWRKVPFGAVFYREKRLSELEGKFGVVVMRIDGNEVSEKGSVTTVLV